MRMIYALVMGTIIAIQAPQLIRLKEYYCGYGVIFGKEHKYPFTEADYKEPFTPSITQIEKAESLFLLNYYDYRVKVIDSFNSNYKVSPKLKDIKKVKKKFFKYYRQYTGYVNNSNDSIIYIGLFNFSNAEKASLYFEGWDKTLFLGSGEFYENNQEFYLVNLNRRNIIFK